MGRPSIDPELMIRMLIVGYCFGIRSERRLCEEVHLNLAYRWFCRLGLEGDVPDHSTFSKNRHGRFRESDLLRQLFETVVRRCITEGMVGGEGFAVDASLIVADANRQTRRQGEERTASRSDQPGGRGISGSSGRRGLRRRDRCDAEVHLADRSGGPLDRRQRAGLLRLLRPTISSIWRTAIIVTSRRRQPIRQAEVGAAKTMIDRTRNGSISAVAPGRRQGLRLGRNARNGWWTSSGIEPHVTVFDKSERARTGPSRAANSPTIR